MKCKNCGAKIDGGVRFCTKCGTPVPQKEESRGKGTKTGAVAVISVVVTLCVCAGAFFLWNHFMGEEEPADEGIEAQQELEITEEKEGTAQQVKQIEPLQEETEPTPVAEDVSEGEYILEGSDVRRISSSELAVLSDYELNLARNEIYARNGRMFDSDRLKAYFESQSWYNGTIRPEDFTEDMLTQIERDNVQLIVEEEERR